MSRIQDILNKAEREGTVKRTRGLGDSTAVADVAASATAAPPRSTAVERTQARPASDRPAAEPTASGGATTPREATLDHRLVAALAPQSLAAEQYPLAPDPHQQR